MAVADVTFKKFLKLIYKSAPIPYKYKLVLKRINKTKFQKFDGWMRIYPTFECTLKCKYCVNDFCPDLDKKLTYELLPAESWIKIVNKTKCDFHRGRTISAPGIHQDYQRN